LLKHESEIFGHDIFMKPKWHVDITQVGKLHENV